MEANNKNPTGQIMSGMFTDPSAVLTEQLTAELTRLRTMEKEYQHVLTLLSVIVENEVPSGEVVIRVKRAHQVAGKEWKEILQLALRDRG